MTTKSPLFSELSGKTAVITGGSGVLGKAMAAELVRQGVKVAILNRDINTGQQVVKEITKEGGQAIAIATDVLSKADLQAAHKKVASVFGPCDILINGAGGNHPSGTTSETHLNQNSIDNKEITTFFDLDPEGIQFVFNLNFIGTLLPTQVFSRDMINRKGCSIINVSSMNAFTPLTKIPAYSGAKAAVSNFTQWLSVHFSKENIRVNAIAPGFFLTDQNKSLLTKDNGELTSRGNTIIEHTPLGKFGEPEDLLGALLWLCSEGATFVTGIVVPVDGGFSAFSGV